MSTKDLRWMCQKEGLVFKRRRPCTALVIKGFVATPTLSIVLLTATVIVVVEYAILVASAVIAGWVWVFVVRGIAGRFLGMTGLDNSHHCEET
ncbi:hypothetical protein EDD21DRAFT_389118 [Dissophora ornata]|nr:hypothetical protein EDD21DRAFT_389118 [Dissophora ornata]